MTIKYAFGVVHDFTNGQSLGRNWYMGNDGVRRWVDNNEPLQEQDHAQLHHNFREVSNE